MAPCRSRGVIGGEVLGAFALAALVRGRLSVVVWFATAEITGLRVYVSSLAVSEVRAVWPDAGSLLAKVLGHASVVHGELDTAAASQVDRLLVAPMSLMVAPGTSPKPGAGPR